MKTIQASLMLLLAVAVSGCGTILVLPLDKLFGRGNGSEPSALNGTSLTVTGNSTLGDNSGSSDITLIKGVTQIDTFDGGEPFINFLGTVSSGDPDSTKQITGDVGDPSPAAMRAPRYPWQIKGLLRVAVNNVEYWVPAYQWEP